MDIRKVDDNTWEIPKQGEMKVPAVIYASARLMEDIKRDQTLTQARNVACLPGILEKAYVMPDAHQGYGFPIGGVAAFDAAEGIISPGGVGYDINCGVRLLRTDFREDDIKARRRELLAEIFKEVPAGVGKAGVTRLGKAELREILVKGAEWAVEQGFGTREDLAFTEENGRMPGAEWRHISERAIERGIPQLGTLGAGNHFLEFQKVEKIFDPRTAAAFGIDAEGQILVMIHCGSRGLGHQVATDYIKLMEDRVGVNTVGGAKRKVCLHRKGATRSFGPGRSELPEAYRSVGQPVIIPGSMGTASYILAGTDEAESLSFGSTAHGAGRVMSRHEAMRRFRGEEIRDELARRGIELRATSWKGVAEEASAAYKDVDEVVRVSDEVGLGKLVARVVPLGVMKG
ncbi:MAG: RNA-splicing ligase RtcB [Candidatus Aminicenantes bacterium RBG_13_63_10]|nr:MAG: RNA-splicing ligase RtcB [Candidatus Aminicenantes bacterium RBG_13_63_10]